MRHTGIKLPIYFLKKFFSGWSFTFVIFAVTSEPYPFTYPPLPVSVLSYIPCWTKYSYHHKAETNKVANQSPSCEAVCCLAVFIHACSMLPYNFLPIQYKRPLGKKLITCSKFNNAKHIESFSAQTHSVMSSMIWSNGTSLIISKIYLLVLYRLVIRQIIEKDRRNCDLYMCFCFLHRTSITKSSKKNQRLLFMFCCTFYCRLRFVWFFNVAEKVLPLCTISSFHSIITKIGQQICYIMKLQRTLYRFILRKQLYVLNIGAHGG